MANQSSAIKAVVIRRGEDKRRTSAAFESLSMDALPAHDVLVEVEFSTINYKDGLALTGGPIARRFPMVAGIDLAGTIVDSADSAWPAGTRVLVNGYGLSETEWGGYSTYQRVKAEWLTKIPDAFTSQDAMSIGTAGYTAMLCVLELERAGLRPGDGKILVTGAAGGVGSFAIALASQAGFEVVASTGKPDAEPYLKGLGASEVIARGDATAPIPALGGETWSGVVDCVGGPLLAQVISNVRYGGCVAACGLTGGTDVPASIFPFILRNVRLQGVDSVFAAREKRVEAWSQLAQRVSREHLASITTVVSFDDVFDVATRIVKGELSGRTVVRIK
ncbi:MDR family oxidoreductase [Caballeronia sp. ATUFL_M1_KS5A]|uniref:MDR family oxidoreductase n=1 Tax=Caballeronia sp. ATUFL_M1_KS5A TaxID=2921778 RepID=UPI0020278683|nr:MDR family oxidoreductase [Caballeronia sp. ATUFL_M1_KS5A]